VAAFGGGGALRTGACEVDGSEEGVDVSVAERSFDVRCPAFADFLTPVLLGGPTDELGPPRRGEVGGLAPSLLSISA